MFRQIIRKLDNFMEMVESIKDNVMDKEKGLYILELLG